jgi:pyruvate dehydrogenase E1 component
MRAVPDQIARWVPGPWQSLGTDGFGFADTRAAARRTFQVDTESIVVSVLQTLAQRGSVRPEIVQEAFVRFRIDDPTSVAGVPQEGGDA